MPSRFTTHEVIAEFHSNYKKEYQSLVSNSKNEHGAHNKIGRALGAQSDLGNFKIGRDKNVSSTDINGKHGTSMQWVKL